MSFWADKNLNFKRTFSWIGYVNLFSPTNGIASSTPLLRGASIPPFLINSFTKPNLNFEIVKSYSPWNSEEKNKIKKTAWAPITIRAVDASKADSNTTKILYDWMLSQGYNAEAQAGSGSPKDMHNLLKNLNRKGNTSLIIETIGSDAGVIEKWEFLNPILTEFDFGGEMSYDTDAVSYVTMQFEISAAKYSYIGKSIDNS
tara:strand:+ start:1649 stop:2251 length:603 start_codon:yes stop_codon:yes gene_type:complete